MENKRQPPQQQQALSLAYVDGKHIAGRGVLAAGGSGVLDSLFGCFKPLSNLMVGKQKPESLENQGENCAICTSWFLFGSYCTTYGASGRPIG